MTQCKKKTFKNNIHMRQFFKGRSPIDMHISQPQIHRNISHTKPQFRCILAPRAFFSILQPYCTHKNLAVSFKGPERFKNQSN